MPGKRSPDQKLIPVPMNEDFINEINKAVGKSGYASRAEFIRDAIIEKIQALGIKLPPELAIAPTRIGKGNQKKAELPPIAKNAVNLLPDPNLDPKVKSAADKLERLLLKTGKVKGKKAS